MEIWWNIHACVVRCHSVYHNLSYPSTHPGFSPPSRQHSWHVRFLNGPCKAVQQFGQPNFLDSLRTRGLPQQLRWMFKILRKPMVFLPCFSTTHPVSNRRNPMGLQSEAVMLAFRGTSVRPKCGKQDGKMGIVADSLVVGSILGHFHSFRQKIRNPQIFWINFCCVYSQRWRHLKKKGCLCWFQVWIQCGQDQLRHSELRIPEFQDWWCNLCGCEAQT